MAGRATTDDASHLLQLAFQPPPQPPSQPVQPAKAAGLKLNTDVHPGQPGRPMPPPAKHIHNLFRQVRAEAFGSGCTAPPLTHHPSSRCILLRSSVGIERLEKKHPAIRPLQRECSPVFRCFDFTSERIEICLEVCAPVFRSESGR